MRLLADTSVGRRPCAASRPPGRLFFAFVWLACATAWAADPFVTDIRPVLQENCGACHGAARARGPANFLKAQSAKDIEAERGLWRNVAAQLRNRTMPPAASKLTEEDRIHVAAW